MQNRLLYQKKLRERLQEQPSLFQMKKFITFILLLAVLILSEYYFLIEVFTKKRLPVAAVSLFLILICIFAFIRFFKKTVLTPDHI